MFFNTITSVFAVQNIKIRYIAGIYCTNVSYLRLDFYVIIKAGIIRGDSFVWHKLCAMRNSLL